MTRQPNTAREVVVAAMSVPLNQPCVWLWVGASSGGGE